MSADEHIVTPSIVVAPASEVVMGSTILVVEDEALIADDIQRTLQRHGYNVPLTAATAREAIDAAHNLRPRLVLMDIKLQGPGDGIDAAAVIRGELEIPVVYLTSHSDDATLVRAMQTAPSGYLLKPFSDRELKTAIEVALHKHQLETRLAERERWFSTILQSIGDAVIVTDLAKIITFMNTVAENLTGLRSHAAIGRSLDEVFRVSTRGEMRQIDGAASSGPTLLVRRDGSELAIAERRAPMRDARGNPSGEVLVFRDATWERKEQQRLEALALTDPVTGVANRRSLELRLSLELRRSIRYKRPLSCMMIDIDHFKSINDTQGHAVGDLVLASIAELIKGNIRAGIDLVARYGGEEFVVILPETALAVAVVAAERLRVNVAGAQLLPEKLKVTLSIGVAAEATDDLVVRADAAMYAAKRNGRNRVEVWDGTALLPLATGPDWRSRPA